MAPPVLARREADATDSSHSGTLSSPPGRSPGSLATLVGIVLVLIGALIGAGELHDNSFLTHLATGRWIAAGHVGDLWMGTSDPYLATSTGRTWVVQSWFASVCYSLAESVAGAAGVRLLVSAITAGLVAALWRLSAGTGDHAERPLLGRVVAVGGVIAIGGTVWSERPLMFGLLFLAVALLAADGIVRSRWLVVIGWLWVNIHGSFPLGIAALGAIAVGAALDRRFVPTADATRRSEWQALRDLVIGCLLGGMLSPVGPVLLTLPVTLLRRREMLAHIQEWQPPDLAQGWARLFVLFAAVAVVALARRRSFRSGIPTVVFVAAGAMAARNVLVASVVLSSVIARGLAGLGSIGDVRRPLLRPCTVALGVLAPVLVLATAATGDYRLGAYPVGAVDFLEQHDLLDGSVRVIEEDYVGNYLAWRYGAGVGAFIDDRYDLHDDELVDDYVVLRRGLAGWAGVLDRREVDVVLWSAGEELTELLASAPGWRVAYDDRDRAAFGYVVFCRTELTRCFVDAHGR